MNKLPIPHPMPQISAAVAHFFYFWIDCWDTNSNGGNKEENPRTWTTKERFLWRWFNDYSFVCFVLTCFFPVARYFAVKI